MRRIRLLAFPLLEAAGFAGAAFLLRGAHGAATWLSVAACLGAAALAACFTLHVSIHELVHQPPRNRLLAGIARAAATLLAGVPFHGYACHHMNHHRFANGLEDWSSTWRRGPGGEPLPRGRLSYALGWPLALARSQRPFRDAVARGEIPRAAVRAIRGEQVLLLAFLLALGILDLRLAAAWIALVYASWVLISIHNYGQHPPRDDGRGIATSYRGRLYNALTCNNGLHHEHHAQAGLPFEALAPAGDAPIAKRPHLLS